MARTEALEERKAQGGRQVSFSFTAAEVGLMEDVKKLIGTDINKDAVLAGFKALKESGAIDEAAVLERVAKRLRSKK